MKFRLRAYGNEDDYWRIRQFLREVYLLNSRRQLSWEVVRFDYWRWHVNENIFHFPLADAIFIWETDAGQIAAVLNPDGKGEAFLQMHPALRTPALEEEMMTVAEERLAEPDLTGSYKVQIWADGQDTSRQALLVRRGYTKGDWPEYQRRRLMDLSIPDTPIAAGYTVRALGDRDEHPARSWVSWQAFHPHEPDESYQGWTWYQNVQRCPLYRRDLDIVAVAAGGEFAAFCTVWFDDVTRTGVFEPVGTAPAHQRRGLGKAVMCEGLRRLKRLGATLATVDSYSVQAGALYASVGFTAHDLSERWVREF